jgi:hypothetical protein
MSLLHTSHSSNNTLFNPLLHNEFYYQYYAIKKRFSKLNLTIQFLYFETKVSFIPSIIQKIQEEGEICGRQNT